MTCRQNIQRFEVPLWLTLDAKRTTVTFYPVIVFFFIVVTIDFGSPTYTIPEDGNSLEVCLITDVGNAEPLTIAISTAPKSALRK